jgi:MFS family permease
LTDAAAPRDFRQDWKVIALITGAHAYSHFFILGLPALFKPMQPDLDVTFFALGWLAALFSIASGGAQFIMGIMTDRWGASRVLFGGMIILAVSIGLVGVAPWFWAMVPLAAVAGMGNSVFHPANYSILSHNVRPERMGRAFAFHQLGGSIGFGIGPLATVLLALQFGWRGALMICGIAGLGLVFLLWTQRHRFATEIAPRVPGRVGAFATFAADFRVAMPIVASAPIFLMFVFYCFVGGVSVGITGAAPAGLGQLFQTALVESIFAVSMFQFGTAAGVLAGGWLADRLKRFDLITGIGYACSAACLVVAATVPMQGTALAALFAAAGFMGGTVTPARDLMVRSLIPKGQSGKVFGFVGSGFDVGAAVLPPLLGLMLDLKVAIAAFLMIAACQIAAVLLAAMALRAKTRRAAATAAE